MRSGNVIYKISARIQSGNVYSNPKNVSVLTKKTPGVTWPYLYLQNIEGMTSSTGIIAHAVNATGAVQIDWSLNGNPLAVKSDGMIYPGKSGKLVCIISWVDGSCDMLVKELKMTEE